MCVLDRPEKVFCFLPASSPEMYNEEGGNIYLMDKLSKLRTSFET